MLDFFIKSVYTVRVMNHNNLMQDGLRNGQVETLIEKLLANCEEIAGEVTRKVVKDNHTYQREWEQVSVVIGSTFEIVLGREWERGKVDETSVYMLIKQVADRLLLRKRYWKFEREDKHVIAYWKKVHDIFHCWNHIQCEIVRENFDEVVKSL